MDVIPEVSCQKVCQEKNANFDIELELSARPTCCIRETKIIDTKCGHTCVFRVDVENNFSCVPHLKSVHGKPRAKFDLDVDIDLETSCKSSGAHC